MCKHGRVTRVAETLWSITLIEWRVESIVTEVVVGRERKEKETKEEEGKGKAHK